MFDFNFCTECHNTKLIMTSHELVCDNCGFVLVERIMIEDPGYKHRMEQMYEDEVETKTSIKNVIDILTSQLHIPETICNYGASLFQGMQGVFKGNQLIAMVCACIYYAQRDMHVGIRNKDEISLIMSLKLPYFLRACTHVKEYLFQSKETRHLVQPHDKYTNTLHCLIDKVEIIPSNEIQTIKKYVYKLYDKIGYPNFKDVRLRSTNINNINVTLIYMACRFTQKQITMTNIATCCNISIATIIKIEKIVKDILSAIPK